MNFISKSMAHALNLITFGALSKEFKRAYYEGAKSTRLNRDFNVTNNHFETLAGPDRNMLKARARWLSENNPICKSIDKSIVKNVVGIGIKLQSRVRKEDYAKADELNRNIEMLWNEFSKKENFDVTSRIGLHKFQKLTQKTKMVDGEILINKIWTNDLKFPLKFQLVENDQFDMSMMKYKKNDVFSGVEVDKIGKPVAYHLKTSINAFDSKRFDISQILHYYNIERATQYRGITDYAQTINNLKDFQAFNDNVIVKNRIQSSFGMIIKTNDSSRSLFLDKKEAQKQGSSDPIRQITAGMIKYLRPNEEMQTLQSTQQGSDYPNFVETTVRLIAAGRDISYELAFRDYSKVNFASSRAGLIQDNKRFDDEQTSMVSDVLNPMFESFLDSQVLIKQITVPSDYWTNKEKYIKPVWIMPRREWVDPFKDVRTVEKEVQMGINCKTDAAAARGGNYEDILRKKLEEERLEKQLRKEMNLQKEEEE